MSEILPVHAYQLWLAFGMLLAIGEIFTPGFYFLCVAISCLVPSLVAALGAGFNTQLAAFCGASVALLLFYRLELRERLAKKPAAARTNADAMVGREAEALVDIAEGKVGEVRLGGEIWRARAEDGFVQQGQRVFVLGIQGLELQVGSRPESAQRAD